MQPDELNIWREANRLFAGWLAQDEAGRDGWLSSQRVEGDVASLLRQLIARQASDNGATLAVDAMVDFTAGRPPAQDALSGRRVGEWTLLNELGRGGMSVVYRASRSGDGFEQMAAVKLLAMAALGSEGSARFEQERAILARLRHPHIATLIDGGIADDGTPYLAMALVEGLDLATYCQALTLDWRERVRLVRMACDAVAFAHRNLLVHRDIKPSNILVTHEGVPVLLDFGIAKLLDDESEHTRTGMRALTPGYAAPEQLKAETVTTATDVYALGIVLRNLCARIDAVPADLRNIIGKATRLEPERRYPDARALGDDLDRLLQQRPVEATPDSWPYRLRVLLRRRRGAVVAAALVIASLVAGLGAALWQSQRVAHEAAEARRQAARAEASRDFLFSIVRAGDRTRGEDADIPVSQVIARGVLALEDHPPADPELHAEMAMMLGELETHVGHYESAARLFEASGQQLRALDNAPLSAALAIRRGVLANAMGDPPAAIAQFETALDAAEALPDVRKAALVTAALDGWAYAMDNSGRGEQARAHLQHVVEVASFAPPGSDAHAALLMALLPVTRDPQDRLALLTRIQVAHAGLRPTFTDRIALAQAFATTHTSLRQPSEALPWAREAARLTDRVHPGTTVLRARANNNLGHAAANAFALREALSAYSTSLGIYRQLGDRHSPAYAAALHNHALLMRDVGHPREAVPMIEQALALARGHFGDHDGRSVTAERNLAITLAQAGDAARAEATWREARSRLSDEDSVVDRHEMALAAAAIAAARGDVGPIEAHLAEAVRLAESDGSNVLSTVRSRAWRQGFQALALAMRGDAAAAASLFAEAFPSSDDSHADWVPRRFVHLAWADHMERLGDSDAAERHRAAAAELLRAGGLDIDPETGVAVLPE